LAYPGVGVLDPDMYALDVLSMALGNGASSRLYQEVYQKKRLVNSISASNYTPYDKGGFEVQGEMPKDNLKEVLAITQRIIKTIEKQGLSAKELAKTKRQVMAHYIFSNQTSSSFAYRAAVEEALTGNSNYSQEYVEQINKVSNEDIKRVVRKYLQDHSLNITVLEPKKASPESVPEDEVMLSKGEIQKHVLDNGLTVLLREDPTVSVASLSLRLMGGIRFQDPNKGGLSNLTGNIWGTATRSRPETVMSRTIEERGMSVSTSAGYDMFSLNMDMLSEDMDLALELLEDIVLNPSFPQEILDRERVNAMDTLDQRKDDIRSYSSRFLAEELYKKHPYSLDILGDKESLSRITRADLLEHYRSMLNPQQMVLSVFGRQDPAKVLEKLRKVFGKLPKKDRPLPVFDEDAIKGPVSRSIDLEKEQALLQVGFHAPSIKDKDRFGMELINSILGSGLSGRLFVKIRDEAGQSYTASSSYGPGFDTGSFVVYVLTKPEKIDSVKDKVLKELERIRQEDVLLDELKAAKSSLKGSLTRSLATNSSLSSRVSADEAYGLGYDRYKKLPESWDAVTVEDIRRIALQYLDISKAVIMVTKPASKQVKDDE
jgi:zinc protease